MTTKTLTLTQDLLRGDALREALVDSFRKLSPRAQLRNPVMFVVYVGSILTTILFLQALFGKGEASPGFILHVTIWLWFTVLFANFAESVAEGRAKAQAATLRSARREVMVKKLDEPRRGKNWAKVAGSTLRDLGPLVAPRSSDTRTLVLAALLDPDRSVPTPAADR